ncbi:MAG: nucleotidyltransferase family protein [Proteobacteria bacterium]|nr:nucleotidyltransferase family protein [Pseudomonadota bacterium]MBU1389917.1 nucleotidyltransferase family protein [Pseudomonadota bacterium]MBU1542516.1 nucleotidyltransferase family protein [Pseudomonadota bacterium]MBU2429120.1 nucleotidyltransferase family protein [Pseudomonadota bacterium]MBU2479685.1 nucleotidyltransferase family protein [Pseudomonadota bacterium]
MTNNKKHIIDLLKKYKKDQSKKFGITKMGIFGSVARGTATDNSDIDIVVELNKKNLLNRIGLKMSLEDFLGAPVDIVTFREDLSPLLKERIIKDVIYV